MGLEIAGCGNEIWKSSFGRLPFSITHPLENFMGEAQVHLAPGQDSASGGGLEIVMRGSQGLLPGLLSWGHSVFLCAVFLSSLTSVLLDTLAT